MNLEDEKSWSFFMPQVKLSLLAGILLQQPPPTGSWFVIRESEAEGVFDLAVRLWLCGLSQLRFS